MQLSNAGFVKFSCLRGVIWKAKSLKPVPEWDLGTLFLVFIEVGGTYLKYSWKLGP